LKFAFYIGGRLTTLQTLAGFTVAAEMLTITPGLDTVLVLRTSAVEGSKRATLAVG
jgi:threonine/homoserine/homoserine lactone efflux protein